MEYNYHKGLDEVSRRTKNPVENGEILKEPFYAQKVIRCQNKTTKSWEARRAIVLYPKGNLMKTWSRGMVVGDSMIVDIDPETKRSYSRCTSLYNYEFRIQL